MHLEHKNEVFASVADWYHRGAGGGTTVNISGKPRFDKTRAVKNH